jgi:2-polyprenyl-6-methoxyphenol hydroxylase-like FAD-dependent oxidoreductase
MKICIYGAGAIGGLLGAKLALSGQDVTLIARGPHLAAMKEKGLRLRIDGQELTAHPKVTDDPAKAGPQDYVIVTEGPFRGAGRQGDAAAPGAGDRRGHGDERDSLVVFPCRSRPPRESPA